MNFSLSLLLVAAILALSCHRSDRIASAQVAGNGDCNCDGCPNSSNEIAGGHKDLDSAECPEGSVATVTKLRTIADSGEYEILTWNTGGSTLLDDFLSSPYKYRRATAGEDAEVTCFGLADDELPVIGDQRTIQVKLNCESFSCDFRYEVEFGCVGTGFLVDDVGGGGVQVLSDIDDTIVCPFPQCSEASDCAPSELKQFLSGFDLRLESGEFYPGVAELMLGLALGPGADDRELGAYVPAKPQLLSARPSEASLFLATTQDSEMNLYCENVGRREGYPSWGINVDSSFYGSIFDVTDHTEFGQTKARHYDDVSESNPNTRFAFLGDDGQGDVCAAQSMLESANGDRMAAVLIHRTQTNPDMILRECQHPNGTDFPLTLEDGDYNGAVHFHSTHSDAAAWALDRGLISCCSAAAVYRAVAEWVACRCDNGDGGGCSYNGTFPLPTGPYYTVTGRAETNAYCEDVAADQEALRSKISECDSLQRCGVLVADRGGGLGLDDAESSAALTFARTVTAVAVTALLQQLLLWIGQ